VTRYRQPDGFVLGTVEVELPDKTQFEKLLVSGIRIGFMQHTVHRKITVVQCFKCQGFGHIASRCRKMSPACLHCAGAHFSKECRNRDQVKCANCGLAHKAFSSSCVKSPIRRRLQEIRGSGGRNLVGGRSFASVASGSQAVSVDNAPSVVAPVNKAVNIVQPSVSGLSVAQQIDQASSDPPTPAVVSSSTDSSECNGCKETVSALTSRLDRLSDLFIASLQALVSIKKFSSVREIFQLVTADDFPVPKRGQINEICQIAALTVRSQTKSRLSRTKSTAKARSRSDTARSSPDSAKRRRHTPSISKEDSNMSDLDDPDYEPTG
jgi:hypothetical protein